MRSHQLRRDSQIALLSAYAEDLRDHSQHIPAGLRYGYFDDQAREYVIPRPDPPAPWANYLGSPEYGALISNNAGGYSFVRSGANGRILRYVFNQFDRHTSWEAP